MPVKKAVKKTVKKKRTATAKVTRSALETAVGQGELRGERRGRREGQEMERAKLVKSLYETGFTVAKIVKGTKLSETAVKRILGL